MKKEFLSLLACVLLTGAVLNSCEKSETFVIELEERSITIDSKGGEMPIKLIANGQWTVTDVPDWITVDPISGDNSSEITVRIKESREPEHRNANITIRSGDVNTSLDVSQSGLKDNAWSTLLHFYTFERMECTVASNNYHIETNSLLINSSINDKIYLGNLLCHNIQSNTHIPEFSGYTFNPITISADALVGVYGKTYLPSKAEQEAYAERIIAKKPKQSTSFIADNGTKEFYTHKQLHTLGMINMGVKLDEVVSGQSYSEKEMSKKYGLIYSFKHILFTLDMDLMDKVVKEELKDTDKALGVSYVATVSYGSVGLLVVESDTDSRDVRVAINKVMSEQSLSPQEAGLIEAAEVCYVHFDEKNKVQAKKGKLDAINAYKEAILHSSTDNIHPVSFQLADYYNGSLSTMAFSFKPI